MIAALRLRLVEARRRGGLVLLALGVAVVGGVALSGADTIEGRYGLASDIAAVLAYLGAVFFGAFPIATDRERKRAFLPGASPVSPWAWALGNACGAALIAVTGGFLLFVAAAAGAALDGGIETRTVTRITDTPGLVELDAPVRIRVPDDAEHLRLVTRSYLRAEVTVGSPDAAGIEVNGTRYTVFWDGTIEVPVTANPVEVVNRTEEIKLYLVTHEVRALAGSRDFLANALGAGIAPSFGAAAVAAIGSAAGAHLSASVAALLTTLVLLLASMKGFLLETFAFEGQAAAAAATDDGRDHAGQEHRGHHHEDLGPDLTESPARDAAKAIVGGVVTILPGLASLDRTDRVALGEWSGPWLGPDTEGTEWRWRPGDRAVFILIAALAVAMVLGGFGVHLRRTP